MRALMLLLVLTGCAATPELPTAPTGSPSSLPPSEWLEDCPVAARSDASNRALRQAWADNLRSLADCNIKLGSLRAWRLNEERGDDDGD